MSPFAELGLDEAADERAVKRAYAARLRQTRPEDDPAGFQRLHAAYQMALARCRQAPNAARVVPPAPPRADLQAPTGPAIRPAAFDIAAFVAEAIAHAGQGEPQALERWLGGIAPLWSLELKTRAGHQLMDEIYRHAPPMPEACLDALLKFFGLDHAQSGHDPLALHQLRRRIDLAWRLEPSRRNDLALALQLRQKRRKLDRTLRQLQQPFRWPQALCRALPPETVRWVINLVQRLSGGNLALLPPSFDRRQLAFWLAAADRRQVNRVRLALAAARTLAALVLSLPLGLMCGLLSGDGGGDIHFAAVAITALVVLGLCVVAFLLAAWSQLVYWQTLPPPSRPALRWLHLGLVPLLVGTGVVVDYASDLPLAGWPILLPAAWLGLARALRGRVKAGATAWLRIALFLLVSALARVPAATGIPPSQWTNAIALVALVAWGTDLWRKRKARLQSAMR